MKRFDCLALDCPILGPHLLEASAGTGKTFAIEHVFVRLLLESIELEKILAVTFTRAAARELKERIRANIEKALAMLQEEQESPWPYLMPWMGDKKSIRILSDALKGFDRCQIFTIHGFCFRILQEFAFEAGLPFTSLDPDKENGEVREKAKAFFETDIDLCPEQMALLLNKYETQDDLLSALLRAREQKSEPFSVLREQFAAKAKIVSEEVLREEFAKLRGQYKKMNEDFEAQIASLARLSDPMSFRQLIRAQGTIFSFLSPENRKLRTKESYSSPFFSWAMEHLAPLVWKASHLKNIFAALFAQWKLWEENILVPEGLIRPDEMLLQMRKAMEIESFANQVRERYQAIIIDEFQDTDPLQWEIFRSLFPYLRALYLVGDPKQSIYRFRNADVYTYFLAKQYLGAENVYHLDTNYRSSQELISALNALFSFSFLPLPRMQSAIPYLPVHAGSSVASDLQDEKKALHWMVGEEEDILPYIASEIERLRGVSIAILVKDRHQMQRVGQILSERQIPFVAKSHETLGETAAFQYIRELLDAVASPHQESLRKIVQQGPFSMEDAQFFFWKNTLEEKGLVSFFQQFLQGRKGFEEILEVLFMWEQKQGFSFAGLKRFLDSFEQLRAEDGGRLKAFDAEGAVQIITLHMSKGLEFDIVFAPGLFSEPPKADMEEEEELNAEKMRQLYVAMTRAKKRLYVPVQSVIEGASPMALFCRALEKEKGPFFAHLEHLARTENVSWERVGKWQSAPIAAAPKKKEAERVYHQAIAYTPSYIQSFTTLAQPKDRIAETPAQELSFPGGKETGTIVHRLFEKIFAGESIEQELRFTSLETFKKPISEMVEKTLCMELACGEHSFCLKDLRLDEMFVEMEFLYAQEPHFIKGFIDLVFWHRGKIYILDWKTNVLRDTSQEGIWAAMEEHDYPLQASIYAEALRRHIENFDAVFGGALYLFVRHGVYVHFNPEKI